MVSIHPTQQDPAVNAGRVLLPSGEVAVFDPADAPLVASYPWRAHRTPRSTYAQSYKRGTYGRGAGEVVLMHRLILDAPAHLDVDHINGDGLDNRRTNLRLGTRSQNAANSRLSVRNTSGYKGVSWHRGEGRWRASIKVAYRYRHLGYFDNPWEAAQAYNAAAFEAWGEFARLNEEVRG